MTDLERVEGVYREQLRWVRKLEFRRDKRAVFAYVYANMTKNVMEALSANAFHDGEAIATLTEIFAGKYLDALNCYEKGEKCSLAWKVVFDTFREKRTTVVDELLICMYVHISYDLPFCLHETSEKLGRSVYLPDHHLVNDMLQETTERMQKMVSDRFSYRLAFLDWALKSNDEVLTNYGLRLMRGMAWYNHLRIPFEPKMADVLYQSTCKHINLVLKGPNMLTAAGLKLFRISMNLLRRWPPAEDDK